MLYTTFSETSIVNDESPCKMLSNIHDFTVQYFPKHKMFPSSRECIQ